MTADQIFERIKQCLVEVLGESDHPLILDTTMEDLKADSLSAFEITFRMESEFGIHVAVEELTARFFGGLKEDEFFDKDRVVTEAGREQLKRVLPASARAALEGTITERMLFPLLTVRQIVALTEEKIGKRVVEVR